MNERGASHGQDVAIRTLYNTIVLWDSWLTGLVGGSQVGGRPMRSRHCYLNNKVLE